MAEYKTVLKKRKSDVCLGTTSGTCGGKNGFPKRGRLSTFKLSCRALANCSSSRSCAGLSLPGDTCHKESKQMSGFPRITSDQIHTHLPLMRGRVPKTQQRWSTTLPSLFQVLEILICSQLHNSNFKNSSSTKLPNWSLINLRQKNVNGNSGQA